MVTKNINMALKADKGENKPYHCEGQKLTKHKKRERKQKGKRSQAKCS